MCSGSVFQFRTSGAFLQPAHSPYSPLQYITSFSLPSLVVPLAGASHRRANHGLGGALRSLPLKHRKMQTLGDCDRLSPSPHNRKNRDENPTVAPSGTCLLASMMCLFGMFEGLLTSTLNFFFSLVTMFSCTKPVCQGSLVREMAANVGRHPPENYTPNVSQPPTQPVDPAPGLAKGRSAGRGLKKRWDTELIPQVFGGALWTATSSGL